MRSGYFAVAIWLMLAVSASAQEAVIPLYRVVPGATALAQGPPGSLYVLSTAARFPPTRGSWNSSCLTGSSFSDQFQATVARISTDLSTVFWSSCVPFQVSRAQIKLDQRSFAPVIAGPPSGNFVSTSGASPGPGIIDSTGVVRLRADGSASEFAWLSSRPQSIANINERESYRGFAILQDGSFVIALATNARGLPVTPDAAEIQPGPGYLYRLSADGTQILYATYLSGEISGIALAQDGKIWLVGSTRGYTGGFAGLTGRLAIPFANDQLSDEGFVTSFDPAQRKLVSFARFGLSTFSAMQIGVSRGGQVVIALSWFERGVGPELVAFAVDSLGTSITVLHRIPTGMDPSTLAFDAAGNWIVAESFASGPLLIEPAERRNGYQRFVRSIRA